MICMPVSYTHLDVYKRQERLSPEEKKYIWGVQANLWAEWIPTMKRIESVSYTHLACHNKLGKRTTASCGNTP